MSDTDKPEYPGDPLPGLKAIAKIAGRSWAQHDKDRMERMQNNPHNGTLGWWSVIGVRHAAVARASSAIEAVEKAKRFVEDWESPEAYWIGVDLPGVFQA